MEVCKRAFGADYLEGGGMTHDEIDKLEAGRELDALVAEGMGWKEVHSQYQSGMMGLPGWTRWWGKKQNTEGRWRNTDLPKYSSDISPAWEVLHLGHPCGWFDAYYFYRYGNGYAISRIHNPKNEQGTKAPTAPLAICRAFLKAVSA